MCIRVRACANVNRICTAVNMYLGKMDALTPGNGKITHCCLLHIHLGITYVCWDYTKSPGEKPMAVLYTNRNNIDMAPLAWLHVPIHNMNME